FERFALDLATGSAAVLDAGSRAAEKMPRVSGAECFGGTSDDRICGTIDNRRLARPLRPLCDGAHKECAFWRELSWAGRRSVAACAPRALRRPRRVPRC